MESTGPSVDQQRSVADYPVTFAVEYPDRELNRLTTVFRIFAVIPIFIVAAR